MEGISITGINIIQFISFSSLIFTGFKLIKINNDNKKYIAPCIKQDITNENFSIDCVDDRLKKYVYYFLAILSKNKEFKHFNMTSFYNNVKDLTITVNSIKNKEILGTYSTLNNSINISNIYGNYKAIFHELFHMASTYLSGNMVYSGFFQYNRSKNNSVIGYGINEGYTQYLTKKYFNDNGSSYIFEEFIAERLVDILGSKDMLDMYSRADLLSLVNSLGDLSSSKQAYTFITDIDYLNRTMKKKKKSNKEITTQKEKMLNIGNTLIACYEEKLTRLVNQNIISRREKSKSLTRFKRELSNFNYSHDNIEYKLYIDTYSAEIEKGKVLVK